MVLQVFHKPDQLFQNYFFHPFHLFVHFLQIIYFQIFQNPYQLWH